MKVHIKKLAFLLIIMILTGCTVGHKKFYNQVGPSKYPETTKVMIFEYSNVELNEIYKLLFSDFLIIGES